jgi:hypothetical protein
LTNYEEEKNELERYQLIFDLISERFKVEWQLTNDLDTKASSLIGFVGIILSLEGIFVSLILTNLKLTNNFFWLYLIFLVSIIPLICSMISGLMAFRVQEWDYAPDAKNLIKDYAKSHLSKLTILEDYSEIFSDILIDNRPKNEQKAKFIQLGYIFLTIGIIFVIAFISIILLIWR